MTSRTIREKLKSRRGESLAEVMVAILIIAVALVLLSSLVIASSRMVDNGGKKMHTIYSASSAMETHDASMSSQQLDIVSDKAIKNATSIIPVKVYKYTGNNSSIKMISYTE